MFGKKITNDDENGSENKNADVKKRARVAGLLYLSVIVFGVFAQIIRMNLIVSGDVAASW